MTRDDLKDRLAAVLRSCRVSPIVNIANSEINLVNCGTRDRSRVKINLVSCHGSSDKKTKG